MDIFRLWHINKREKEELLYLLVFGVLEVKDGLDRTGRIKKRQKLQALKCGPRCTS